MNNVSTRIRFADQQVEKHDRDCVHTSRPRSPHPCLVTHTDDEYPFGVSDISLWLDQRFPAETFPQIRKALEKNQISCVEQDVEDTSVGWESCNDSGSTCSSESFDSTFSEANFKTYHKDQFAKLLPRNTSTKQELISKFLEKLSPNIRIPQFFTATKVDFPPHSHDTLEHHSTRTLHRNNDDHTKKPLQIVKPPFEASDLKPSSAVNAQDAVLSPSPSKPALPEGRDLEDVQLEIQERILTQIKYQALENTQMDSVDAQEWQTADFFDTEEEPNKLDRELEVTFELLKRVRRALDEGTYRDMYFSEDETKQESVDEKYKVLCEVLLMLKYAVRDLLLHFGRIYRPTSFLVTDKELIEEMDAYLLAREELTIMRPLRVVEKT